MATQCERCAEHNPEDARFCKGCGAPLAQATPTRGDPLINQVVLDRYVIKHLLGEGGMGRVYAAEQRVGTTTRRVAVKTLLAQLSADPQIVKRFYREAETIVRLSHPNIISFFDFGALPDGTLVIVMEYIEGESLAQCLSRGPINTARADAILTQVCGALAEAHALGIVHRDLKPDNILLTTRGGQSDFVKVLDFGIAKISAQEQDLGAATKLTQQGMIIGTPPYMSPEQFRGDPVDARSDIYSLGVIAYEMHTARLPFDAKTPWEWASKHLTAEPEDLRVDVSAGVSEQRAAAIRKALAKTPENRPKTVEEFLSAIRSSESMVTATSPVQRAVPGTLSTPAPAVTPARTPQLTDTDLAPPKRSSLPLFAGIVAALFGLGAVGLFALRSPAAEPSAHAIAPPSLPHAQMASRGEAAASAAAFAGVSQGRDHAGAPERTAQRASEKGESERSSAVSSKPRTGRGKDRTHESERPNTAEASPAKTVETSPKDAQPSLTGPAANQAATAPAKNSETAQTSQTARPVAPVAGTTSARPQNPTTPTSATPADLSERVRKGLEQARERPDVAMATYQGAVRLYGARHPALSPLASAIQQHGDRRIRKLVGDGLCAQAQALYRGLASAGLQGGAASAFNSRCALPR